MAELKSKSSENGSQERIDALCEELEAFKTFLVEVKKDESIWMNGFKKVHTQLKTAKNSPEGDFIHNESLWLVAKTCTAITSLRHYFEMYPRNEMKLRKNREEIRTSTTIVDIVCENGSEWVRVINMTAKRAMWEFVNAGYGAVYSDSEEDEDDEDDFDDPTGLVAQAKCLLQASKLVLHRGKHPRIRFVLPRFHMDEVKALNLGDARLITRAFDRLRALGIIIETSGPSPPYSPSIGDVLHSMTSPDLSTVTSTLNIDTTILLAMVSDISHGTVDVEEWHHDFVKAQIEREQHVKLLPSHVWPICGSRKLICAREAFDMMHTITKNIGTDTEKARATLLFNSPTTELTQEERLVRIQKLSEYDVPKGWSLPIDIVNVDLPGMLAQLPAATKTQVFDACSRSHGQPVTKDVPVNASVFLYGWVHNFTTLTSNDEMRKVIADIILRKDDQEGPDIWSLTCPRSLVGKEKNAHVKDGYGQQVMRPISVRTK
ncbi:hypothetical protein BJ878DRAFT_506691 [Calycina marina]|uniref:DUF1308 domain-containing protein n=1 Tax=Calycina marina TaxID=1763456 RepID=A0A9P7Z3R6_9HELO|nr:hypothetical protein BJ878DRAFT_506691 [Calycina marina]